jgi:hypothetical protein
VSEAVPPERQWFRTVTTDGKGGGLSVGTWFQGHPPYGADKVILGPYDERVDPETVKDDYRNDENIHRRPGESLRGDDDGE